MEAKRPAENVEFGELAEAGTSLAAAEGGVHFLGGPRVDFRFVYLFLQKFKYWSRNYTGWGI